MIYKKNSELGISYYEYSFELNLDFNKIKEFYLRNNQDVGNARIPIYFILSNGEVSSLPNHNYLKAREARHIELSWVSGYGYGVSEGDFDKVVCSMKSKFIDSSSEYLYQNVLYKFIINMD